MSNYDLTRDAARKVTSRFSRMLRELRDDLGDEVVVVTLMNYHEMCSAPDKIDNSAEVIEPDKDLLRAIERVLQDFMPTHDFNLWLQSRENKDE